MAEERKSTISAVGVEGEREQGCTRGLVCSGLHQKSQRWEDASAGCWRGTETEVNLWFV